MGCEGILSVLNRSFPLLSPNLPVFQSSNIPTTCKRYKSCPLGPDLYYIEKTALLDGYGVHKKTFYEFAKNENFEGPRKGELKQIVLERKYVI